MAFLMTMETLINETYRNTPLVQKYLETIAQVRTLPAQDQRADAVFNHLYIFFSRYYESGDFIPRRRYSQTDRYAVPYNGEEVYLHWANRDQYYVKSGAYFSPLTDLNPKMSPLRLNFAM